MNSLDRAYLDSQRVKQLQVENKQLQERLAAALRTIERISKVQPPHGAVEQQNVMATGMNRYCQLHDRHYYERCPECRWQS